MTTDGWSKKGKDKINKRLGALIGKINIIMNWAENPQMMGMQNSMCACTLHESDEIVDKLEDFQNKLMLRFFEAPKQGTPTGIVELDSNMLLMKNRILLSKLTYVGKVMAKSLPNNMCRRALINGKLVCKGKDLLTECEDWSRELRIQM